MTVALELVKDVFSDFYKTLHPLHNNYININL